MIRRYTILLLIPHLGGGGAERVIALLARSLSRDRFEVNLGLVTSGRGPTELPPWVHVHELNATRVLYGAARVLRLVRKIKPDLILSGMFHLNFVVLLLKPFFPRTTHVLVRQNGMVYSRSPRSSFLERLLYRLTYPLAHAIICQSHAMADEMRQLLGLSAPIKVLRNPVDIQGVRRAAERPSRQQADPEPHLLAVGRLSWEKGFDLLLKAFAAVKVRYPEADLLILGDGRELGSLESQCIALGLNTSVRFAGHVPEPASWFGPATLLVVPSRSEAFPNVLLEAAAAGLPIVAMPSSPGMNDLIRDQPGTWLAREVSSEALARSIEAALATLRPGERFRHSWLAPFELGNAVEAYEALILEVLSEQKLAGVRA